MTLAGVARPVHQRPGNGMRLRVLTDLVRTIATAADTGGAYTLLEAETPPAGGFPVHTRRYDDASLFVLAGTYRVLAGDDEIELGPGGYAFVPRGTALGYANVGPGPARMLVLVTPGGSQEQFLDDVGDRSGRPPWQIDMARVLAVAPRYGIELATPAGPDAAGGAPG
jgi:quercetin dioxygenase-like cupin family protein